MTDLGQALIDPMGWLPLPVADADPDMAAKQLAVERRGPGLRSYRLATALRAATRESIERKATFALALAHEGRGEIVAVGQCFTHLLSDFDLVADPGPPPGAGREPAGTAAASSLCRQVARSPSFGDPEPTLFGTNAGMSVRVRGMRERLSGDRRGKHTACAVEYLVPCPDLAQGFVFDLVFRWDRELAPLSPELLEMADERAATFVLVLPA